MPQRHVSTIHSMSTLTVSRERQKPASSMVKPACMPNPRNAATTFQPPLMGLIRCVRVAAVFRSFIVMGSLAGSRAAAGAVEVDGAGAVAPISIVVLVAAGVVAG